MPEAKVGGLHGPHQPAYIVSPTTASPVVVLPAPVSWMIVQSHALAEHVVSKPFVLSQTNSPPATQCVVGAFGSARNGAMKRGLGSHGFGVYVTAEQDGEISRKLGVSPVVRPPLVVSAMSRPVYSTTARLPSLGSTRVSPPSPPNGETICLAPGSSSD